ncbi:MAG: PBS lyase [Proteobacteria bacterium]|nr:PBS lyase [Pseudomonadota bacterium]
MGSKAEAILKPWCPFCGMDVGRPVESVQRKMREFPMGTCECRAVYVSDTTGHNIGAAMVECLVNACNDQWDLAWELIPEDDYLTGIIEDYDEVTHQVVPKRNLDGRAVRGVLFFVRLHKEMDELVKRFPSQAVPQPARQTEAGEMPAATPTAVSPRRDPKRPRQRADKQMVREMALCSDIGGLVALYGDDRKVLRYLQRLLYDPETGMRYRIAWVLGQVCGRVATSEPGPVADLLHRLFEACSDSAASSWGMIESIGAIIAARPDIYGAFTRHLFNFMGDPGTREAVLWGLGEIAATRPDLIRKIPFYALFPVLNHADPVFRGLTLRLLGRIKAKEAGFQIMGLSHDTTPITIYEQGWPVQTTVAELCAQATRLIHEEAPDGK